MRLIDEKYLDNFLNERDYDIRKSHNARWIDQKCTPDVITIIADCILEFSSNQVDDSYFSSGDIWHNGYTVHNVLEIFKKPSPQEKTTKSEYDKFFSQPMEMFAYAGILKKRKKGRRNYYVISEKKLMNEIALSERNALKFLVRYIAKVLNDSDIHYIFENFFKSQDKESFVDLKKGFASFIKEYTPINGVVECSRIFTKVINPLAFSRNLLGTERGRLSLDLVTYDMLIYNRDNFRDISNRKPKGIVRGEYNASSVTNNKYIEYLTIKAIKNVKLVNNLYNSGLSEVTGDDELASEVHHIFSKSEFPQIAFFLENLISLTPNQHRNHAHPNGNYSLIDKEYQKICLIAKVETIKKSIANSLDDYDFVNFLNVLNYRNHQKIYYTKFFNYHSRDTCDFRI